MTLGQKLKKLRGEKELTQKDLADKLHVTFQTVSKWENDENEPDITTLKELAKLYNCSVDYLLSEEEQEKPKEVEEKKEEKVEAPAPAPVEVVTKTIIVHQNEAHVCARCGKDIPEIELVSEDITKQERHGRSTRTVSVGQTFYHKDCLEEVKKERIEAERQKRIAYARKAKIKSFGWGIAGGVIAFAIALLVFIVGAKDQVHPALGVLYSAIISYFIFSMLYCIISGSYISDVFLWCAGLTVRFPGLIFTWDIQGFVWLIAMKILFAILGFIIGVLALLFAILFSSALGGISFPFVLIHNIRTQYKDALV